MAHFMGFMGLASLPKCRKSPKNSNTWKIYCTCNYPKLWLMWIFVRVMRPNEAEKWQKVYTLIRMLRSNLILVCTVFAQICLSENLETLRVSLLCHNFCLGKLDDTVITKYFGITNEKGMKNIENQSIPWHEHSDVSLISLRKHTKYIKLINYFVFYKSQH